MVYDILDVAVNESLQIIYGVVDAMVGDAALRIIIGPYLCRAVACRYHRLAARGYIVDIFLVLLVVDECAQAAEGAFLVLGWSRVSVHSMSISSDTPVLGLRHM